MHLRHHYQTLQRLVLHLLLLLMHLLLLLLLLHQQQQQQQQDQHQKQDLGPPLSSPPLRSASRHTRFC